MPARSHAPDWVRGLRNQLRSTVGTAYRVGEQRGKSKLDVRFADGSRSTTVLPLKWLPAQAGAIQRTVESISQAIAAGSTLKEAVALQVGEAIPAPAPVAAPDGSQLMAAWVAFGQYKVQQTGQIKPETWSGVYGTTANHLAMACDAKDADDLLRRVGQAWEPGARRRQITCQHIAAMLRWACGNKLLPADRWTPPSDLAPYVGTRIATPSQATPLSDEQILALIEGLPNDAAGKRWQYVFQLLATYGLRPVEVTYLQLKPDGLWCTYQKRSGGGTTKPRRLKPLHPEWEREWQLIERITAGEEMPPFGGGVADAARRYLYRQSVWTPIKAKGCTAYGFRHGFALRAHQQYGLSVRVASALMGHSTETHQRHYGSWADADTVDAALEAGLRFRAMTNPTMAGR